jgi:glycosyltransferase involved in cell wall biosynthesis
MVSTPRTTWIFVNDGSTDDTQMVLTEFVSQSSAQALELTKNSGKAEAVRQGILHALNTRTNTEATNWVGFIDADTSFSPDEIPRFLQLAESLSSNKPQVEAIWAARVALLGRDIHRTAFRHYVGRVLATAMNAAVSQLPYDSQAGFKLFKNSPILTKALREPFKTRWLFDIELLQRWQAITGKPMLIWEEPLHYWHHTEGSHVSAADSIQILKEIAFLYGQRPRKT